jgi:ATP-dependent phosphofructokinase / diphosphate-dependent phosphofructokinase
VLFRSSPDAGPHLVYVPEKPFDVRAFCENVYAVYQKQGRCVIAVSEGIEDKDGTPILQVLNSGDLEADSHGNVQLSGTGALADALIDKVKSFFKEKGVEKLRARGDTLGYLQRSFPDQSSVDREESLGLGRFAAKQALSGNIDGSCAIVRVSDNPYKSEFRLVPLKNVAGKTRHLPDEFVNAEGNNVTDAFIQWGLPLVGELKTLGVLDMSKMIAPK